MNPRPEPHCGACGLVMTPENARLRPELFLHDDCLPAELRPPAKSLAERVETLGRTMVAARTIDQRRLMVDVDLLHELLIGNVPVGGNELPPEEVNARLYAVKGQRDKLLWRLSSIGDLAADELRRLGAVPGSAVAQIEADARATLEGVRGLRPENPQ